MGPGFKWHADDTDLTDLTDQCKSVLSVKSVCYFFSSGFYFSQSRGAAKQVLLPAESRTISAYVKIR